MPGLAWMTTPAVQGDGGIPRTYEDPFAMHLIGTGAGGGGGAPVVQCDFTADERSAARAHMVNDVAMEQIAHRIAYLDGRPPRAAATADASAEHPHEALRAAHVDARDEAGLGELGFDCARFQFFSGENGLQFWILPTLAGSGRPGVIAFRGTEVDATAGEAMQDLAEDATASGVGMSQFTMNQAAIAQALRLLAADGPVVATGHSLGGALAQIAACFYPEMIVSVVTFQAPGISSEILDRIRHVPEERRVDARHHRVAGCIVDDAGEEFVGGEVILHGGVVSPVTDHTTFPALSAAEHDGTADPSWMRGSTIAETATTTRGSAADTGLGRPLGGVGAAEFARTHPATTLGAAGVVGGAGLGGLTGVGLGLAVDAAEGGRDAYARVWLEIEPYAEDGYRTLTQLVETIRERCTAEGIADRIVLMNQNLVTLYPELIAARAASHDPRAMATLTAFLAAVERTVPLADHRRRVRTRNLYVTHGGHIPEGSEDVWADGGSTAAAHEVHAHAARGVAGSGGALPHLARIQASFGRHDVSGVRAHVGGAAADASAAIGAGAYATGNDVAFAAGPDLRQAAHEAAHVVQQRGGVRVDGGVGRPGDRYEQHADDVADLVVRGESAETALDGVAGHGADAGGTAVQRLVDQRDAEAAATMQRLFATATTEENAALSRELLRALDDLPSIAVRVDLRFAHRGEVYHLMLPVADARTLCGEGAQALVHGAREDASRRRAARRARTERVSALRADTLAGIIAGVAGEAGEEQELELQVRVPIPETPILVSGQLTLKVAHEASGYAVEISPSLGLGVGTADRADLLTDFTTNVQGHDANAAATLLVAALEHELRDMATQPPPLFVCAAIAAAGAALPYTVGGAVLADLVARGYNWVTTGRASDPFWLWLADGLFGSGFEARLDRAMAPGDFVETVDGAHLEGEAEGGEGSRTASVGAEIGGGHHWRREDGITGATEVEFDTFDLELGVNLGGVAAAFEVHVPVSPPPGAPSGEIKIELAGHIRAHDPVAIFTTDLIARAVQRLLQVLDGRPEARDAYARIARSASAAESAASMARSALVARAAAASGEGRIGALLELKFSTRRGEPNTCTIKATEELEVESGGEEMSYTHARTLTSETF